MNLFGIFASLTGLLLVSCQNRNTVDKLGWMNVYQDSITLSGFSSGGTFAQMLQFSYSSLFSGIAVFSHTFYRCGPPDGRLESYDRVCTKLANLTENEFYSPNLVHNDIQDYYRRGLIENPTNLKGKRLYVYTGVRNELFTPRQSLGILTVYERYIGSLESVFTRVQDANLVLPTDNRGYGGPCTNDIPNVFFIGQCGFSGVTEAINFLLFSETHNEEEAFIRSTTPRGTISQFDQTEFTSDIQNHQMDRIGYYYVPRKCKGGYHKGSRCYLHFYFHGCLSGREFANATHIENSGLLELAEKKGIIMIFPQALSSIPENEIGCWDTFGISGQFYATQIGAQVKAVKRMLDTIIGRRGRFPSSSSSSQSNQSPNNGAIKWPSTTGGNVQNGKRPYRPSYSSSRSGYGLNRRT